MKVLKKDRVHLRERLALGLESRPEGREAVWIHAVSVGEVLSLQHLIRELKRRHPEWDIVFSTLTHTGIKVAREKLDEADRCSSSPSISGASSAGSSGPSGPAPLSWRNPSSGRTSSARRPTGG